MESIIGTTYILDGVKRSTEDLKVFEQTFEKPIYEVIKVVQNKPLFLDEHLDRMIRSIEMAAFDYVLDKEQTKQQIDDLIAEERLEQNIKLILTREEKPSLLIFYVPITYPSETEKAEGVEVVTRFIKRSDPNMKIQRSEYITAVETAKMQSGAFEILLMNDCGYITEGSKSNVFFIAEDSLYTPESERVLEGITRAKIFQIAGELGLAVIEKTISKDEVKRFDVAFLTGTSCDVLPIRSLDEHSYCVENNILKRIMKEFDILVNKETNK